MTFSRRSVDEPETFDLHELLQSLRELLHQIVGPTVALDLELGAGVPTHRRRSQPARAGGHEPRGERGRRDAHRGSLTLGTTNVPVPGAPPYVVLTITDTGIGMDEPTRNRVFEPFFTTKPPGRGTGLGMSTTADIVKAANATIEVRSVVGRGTTFLLTFPTVATATAELDLRDDAAADATTGTATARRTGPRTETRTAPCSSSTTNPRCARWSRRSCAARGTAVLVATDGDAALAMLAREAVVDLLVTDVVMPVMSGRTSPSGSPSAPRRRGCCSCRGSCRPARPRCGARRCSPNRSGATISSTRRADSFPPTRRRTKPTPRIPRLRARSGSRRRGR